MMRNDICILILSHGRPDNIKTIAALKKSNSKIPFFVVIDDEDKTAEEYYQRYGEKVVMFSKEDISKKFDQGDNFSDRRVIIYARNASFEIAEKLGYRYFMQLDDDYTNFYFKYDDNLVYSDNDLCIKDFDSIIYLMLEYFKKTSIATIAMFQSGDYIGGRYGAGGEKIHIKRKAMNSFICSVDRPFKFFGRINEDVNTYTCLGRRGELFFSTNQVSLKQTQTQSNDGGMTDIYLDGGTYIKSFYSVMYSPSCVKVALLNSSNKRLHHKVNWKKTCPKILRENIRKNRKL